LYEQHGMDDARRQKTIPPPQAPSECGPVATYSLFPDEWHKETRAPDPHRTRPQ